MPEKGGRKQVSEPELRARIAELEAAIGTHREVVLNQSEYDPTSDDVALWAALEGVSDE